MFINTCLCLQIHIVYKANIIMGKDSHIYYDAINGELNLVTTTTQIHFAIDIMNKTQNFQNTSGNYKTKASTSPWNGVSQLMPQHTDVCQGVTVV